MVEEEEVWWRAVARPRRGGARGGLDEEDVALMMERGWEKRARKQVETLTYKDGRDQEPEVLPVRV